MSYQDVDAYQQPVARASEETRSKFITKVYNHVLGAITVFVLLEVYFIQSGIAESILEFISSTGYGWPVLFGGFVAASWAATRFAHTAESKAMQYLNLGLLVLAEGVIFAPMLLMADMFYPGAITNAAAVTLVGFGVLTAIVFMTRKDFSFLRSTLIWIGGAAMVGIVASMIFGFELGTWFSVAMVAFAGAVILYDTSNVLHHYPEDKYVGAATQLFGSLALMFWYILRLFMSSDD